MANSFGLLLLAIAILFSIGYVKRDAKFFSKYMAILLMSLCVGAGVKVAVNKITAKTAPEKTTVTTKVLSSTRIATPFVSENATTCLECVSKNVLRSDNFVLQVEGLPTRLLTTAFIDDS